ncbi:hypothetical protein ACS0TY_027001 [Phlomoides rotata]
MTKTVAAAAHYDTVSLSKRVEIEAGAFNISIFLLVQHHSYMENKVAYYELFPICLSDEDFEFLTYPFLEALGRLPSWFLMAYFFVAYLGVWGKVGMYFWTAMAFAYLFTMLECIRCALAGIYADVLFVWDAAYIQITYH